MRVFLLLISFIIISCSINAKESGLYLSYSHYRSFTDKDNIKKTHSKYFSSKLLGTENINDPEVIDQLLFKNYMEKQYNYFESIQNKKGCLTINGYDESNKPVAFNLEYILSNNRWLINSIHILFIENNSEFSTTAKCPVDYKQ